MFQVEEMAVNGLKKMVISLKLKPFSYLEAKEGLRSVTSKPSLNKTTGAAGRRIFHLPIIYDDGEVREVHCKHEH